MKSDDTILTFCALENLHYILRRSIGVLAPCEAVASRLAELRIDRRDGDSEVKCSDAVAASGVGEDDLVVTALSVSLAVPLVTTFSRLAFFACRRVVNSEMERDDTILAGNGSEGLYHILGFGVSVLAPCEAVASRLAELRIDNRYVLE